uniref:Uncharacterized protein n=1 Tax=Arundo donax TaxID=35708 RepID=A0A0A9A6C2_ARUDO
MASESCSNMYASYYKLELTSSV